MAPFDPTLGEQLRREVGRAKRLIHRLRLDMGGDARLATFGNDAMLFRVVSDAVRIERLAYGGRDLPATFDPA